MRVIPLLLLLLSAAALPAAAQVPASPEKSLAELVKASRWQQRLLLLYAPAPDDASLRRQRELLAAEAPGLAARDLLVRELIGPALSAADQRYLRQRLGVAPGSGFVVLLVGKDGGIKRRETAPLTSARLFSTIDAMPMRQQEMKRRNH